jgi:hypothetical protein
MPPPPVASTVAVNDKPSPTVQVEVGDPTAASGAPSPKQAPGGSVSQRPKPSAPGTAAALDTSGFISTIPGPAATSPSGSHGGGPLSAGEIQGVVAQNQPLVKRKCWQPALDTRSANGPTSARVNGTIVIGSSGNVESATASGAEKDFPGLSSCIAERMKSWRFPPSGGSTPANVPFVFAGQ